MDIFIILFLIAFVLLLVFVIWIYRLYKLYKRGKKKSFTIQVLILSGLVVFVTWEFQIFPLSKNVYIKHKTTELSGRSFWSWKVFDHEDISVRGEGYSLDIYKFNESTADYFKNPDANFFNSFPPAELSDIRWTKTPVKDEDQELLEFVTPIYAGWEGEIIERQEFIRQIANSAGAYYAYQNGGSANFYMIVPDKKLVIIINHNM